MKRKYVRKPKRVGRKPKPKEVRKGRIGTKQNPLRQSDIAGLYIRGKSGKVTRLSKYQNKR